METKAGTTGRARFRVPAGVKYFLKFGLGAVAIWALIRSGGLDPGT